MFFVFGCLCIIHGCVFTPSTSSPSPLGCLWKMHCARVCRCVCVAVCVSIVPLWGPALMSSDSVKAFSRLMCGLFVFWSPSPPSSLKMSFLLLLFKDKIAGKSPSHCCQKQFSPTMKSNVCSSQNNIRPKHWVHPAANEIFPVSFQYSITKEFSLGKSCRVTRQQRSCNVVIIALSYCTAGALRGFAFMFFF